MSSCEKPEVIARSGWPCRRPERQCQASPPRKFHAKRGWPRPEAQTAHPDMLDFYEHFDFLVCSQYKWLFFMMKNFVWQKDVWRMQCCWRSHEKSNISVRGDHLGLRPEQPPPHHIGLLGGCLALRPGWPPLVSWIRSHQKSFSTNILRNELITHTQNFCLFRQKEKKYQNSYKGTSGVPFKSPIKNWSSIQCTLSLFTCHSTQHEPQKSISKWHPLSFQFFWCA